MHAWLFATSSSLGADATVSPPSSFVFPGYADMLSHTGRSKDSLYEPVLAEAERDAVSRLLGTRSHFIGSATC